MRLQGVGFSGVVHAESLLGPQWEPESHHPHKKGYGIQRVALRMQGLRFEDVKDVEGRVQDL